MKGWKGRLRGAVVGQLRLAVLDIRHGRARREHLAGELVEAGWRGLLLKVRTCRDGSLAVTRVQFRGEDVWFVVVRVIRGRAVIRGGFSGYFLEKAGGDDVVRYLGVLLDTVESAGFAGMLMGGSV